MSATKSTLAARTGVSLALAVLIASALAAPASAATGPYLVRDINPSGDSRPAWLTPMGNTLFFVAKGGNGGRELWKSDGTSMGTVRVKDIRAGGGASNPQYLAVANGLLWFNADDGIHGRELWVSDGTTAGTRLVKDIWPGSGSSEPGDFVGVNGIVYFDANNGTTGRDLWRSDGTPAGTRLVKDLTWGAPASFLFCCAAIGSRIFFIQYNPYTGTDRLYVSNGTAKGTKPFRDRNGNLVQGSLGGLTVVGSLLYFSRDEALWRTDGTSAGTRKLADIFVRKIVGIGNTAFISSNVHLWATEGTVASTRLLKEDSYSGEQTFHVGGRLLFLTPRQSGYGDEAWVSDGTVPGTAQVGTQVTPTLDGTVLDGVAYFGGYSEAEIETYDGPTGCMFDPGFLWRSDGTADGTYNVNPELDYCALYLTATNDSIYFTSRAGEHGLELWRYAP